jgi:hypothetical protein
MVSPLANKPVSLRSWVLIWFAVKIRFLKVICPESELLPLVDQIVVFSFDITLGECRIF